MYKNAIIFSEERSRRNIRLMWDISLPLFYLRSDFFFVQLKRMTHKFSFDTSS